MIVTEHNKLSKLKAVGRLPIAGLLLLATFSSPVLAQSTNDGAMPGNILEISVQSESGSQPFQLMQETGPAGFDFDMAGSEVRKLKLQLNQPLMLSAGSQARVLNNGTNLLGLDATLDLPVTSNFSLGASATNQMGRAQFQSLGSPDNPQFTEAEPKRTAFWFTSVRWSDSNSPNQACQSALSTGAS